MFTAEFRELKVTPEGHPEFTHGVRIGVWDETTSGIMVRHTLNSEALREERKHIDEAFGTAWWVHDTYFKTNDLKLLTYLKLKSS